MRVINFRYNTGIRVYICRFCNDNNKDLPVFQERPIKKPKKK